MSGLECFGMFYMGGGREIVECFGRLWNVTRGCGMLDLPRCHDGTTCRFSLGRSDAMKYPHDATES